MRSKKYNINLDSEEEVSRILSALPRVDAPSNFDFGVKAKIAAGKRHKSWLDRIPVAVRFALPTLLILLVGFYLYYNRVQLKTDSQVQQIATTAPAPAIVGSPSIDPSQNNTNSLVARENSTSTPEQARTGNSNRLVRPPSGQTNKSSGGSILEATGQPDTITKPGKEDKTRLPDDMDALASSQSVKRALSAVGIDTVYDAGGWRVVVTNSLAKRSGVIEGDIVTAIGNQQLNQKPIVRSVATQVTVRRGGKPLVINLRQHQD